MSEQPFLDEAKTEEALMLTDLSIQNFRPFQSFKVTDWARVNLIVGENSVGKSSLLEAVHLLVNQGYPQVLLEELEARGEISFLDDAQGQPGYEVKHLFRGRDLQERPGPVRDVHCLFEQSTSVPCGAVHALNKGRHERLQHRSADLNHLAEVVNLSVFDALQQRRHVLLEHMIHRSDLVIHSPGTVGSLIAHLFSKLLPSFAENLSTRGVGVDELRMTRPY